MRSRKEEKIEGEERKTEKEKQREREVRERERVDFAKKCNVFCDP